MSTSSHLSLHPWQTDAAAVAATDTDTAQYRLPPRKSRLGMLWGEPRPRFCQISPRLSEASC